MVHVAGAVAARWRWICAEYTGRAGLLDMEAELTMELYQAFIMLSQRWHFVNHIIMESNNICFNEINIPSIIQLEIICPLAFIGSFSWPLHWKVRLNYCWCSFFLMFVWHLQWHSNMPVLLNTVQVSFNMQGGAYSNLCQCSWCFIKWMLLVRLKASNLRASHTIGPHRPKVSFRKPWPIAHSEPRLAKWI